MLNSKQRKNLIVASQSRELYTTKRFLEEGIKLGFKAKYFSPYQSSISLNYSNDIHQKKGITSPFSGLYLHRTTGVNFDDFDLVTSKYYESLGWHISNPINAIRLMRNKDEQAMFMHSHLLPLIPTFLFRGESSSEIIEEISEQCRSTKFILKMSRGNKGVGVNLIESVQSLKSLLDTFHAMKDQKMLIQPFIPHEKEWRVFIIKNEIVASVEKKIMTDDFRGNALRARPKLVKKLDRELSDMALNASFKSGLDYAGIDIIESAQKGQRYLCEINPVAGFEQIESLSKINIAKEIITHI